MNIHANNSTRVELISQQLYFESLQSQSNVVSMNLGKRLKAELELRSMKPVNLCTLIPELDIGTLSAMILRDSVYSKYAPEIAKTLGLELHWLLTGEEPKFKSEDGAPSIKSATNKQLTEELSRRLAEPAPKIVAERETKRLGNGVPQ